MVVYGNYLSDSKFYGRKGIKIYDATPSMFKASLFIVSVDSSSERILSRSNLVNRGADSGKCCGLTPSAIASSQAGLSGDPVPNHTQPF